MKSLYYESKAGGDVQHRAFLTLNRLLGGAPLDAAMYKTQSDNPPILTGHSRAPRRVRHLSRQNLVRAAGLPGPLLL